MTLAALFVAVATAAPSNLASTCPAPPPPCEALQKSTIVLLADVLETGSGERIASNPLPPQTVRLKVIERFKGVTREEGELRATILLDSNSVTLAAGKQFLVYVTTVKGLPPDVWSTGCSRTKPLDDSSRDELEQLRQCAKREPLRVSAARACFSRRRSRAC